MEVKTPNLLDHPFPKFPSHTPELGASSAVPLSGGAGRAWGEPGVPHPPLLPPFSLSKCEWITWRAPARTAGLTCRARRRAGASPASLPQDLHPVPLPRLTRPLPATGPRLAHRHEAGGGGNEHTDDHPLAAPGHTVCPLGLWAGADAEAKFG